MIPRNGNSAGKPENENRESQESHDHYGDGSESDVVPEADTKSKQRFHTALLEIQGPIQPHACGSAASTLTIPARNPPDRLGKDREALRRDVRPDISTTYSAILHPAITSRPRFWDHLVERTSFQSFFMLMTTQPSFMASSYSSWVNAPTLVSGRPCAGP